MPKSGLQARHQCFREQVRPSRETDDVTVKSVRQSTGYRDTGLNVVWVVAVSLDDRLVKSVLRRTGRVLAVHDGSVLLLRGGDPGRPDAGQWWLTIGGGCEPGETTAAAARREAREEARLILSVDLGPVVLHRKTAFEFEVSGSNRPRTTTSAECHHVRSRRRAGQLKSCAPSQRTAGGHWQSSRRPQSLSTQRDLPTSSPHSSPSPSSRESPSWS